MRTASLNTKKEVVSFKAKWSFSKEPAKWEFIVSKILPKEDDDDFILAPIFKSIYFSKLAEFIKKFNSDVIALNLVGYFLNLVGNKSLKILSERC